MPVPVKGMRNIALSEVDLASQHRKSLNIYKRLIEKTFNGGIFDSNREARAKIKLKNDTIEFQNLKAAVAAYSGGKSQKCNFVRINVYSSRVEVISNNPEIVALENGYAEPFPLVDVIPTLGEVRIYSYFYTFEEVYRVRFQDYVGFSRSIKDYKKRYLDGVFFIFYKHKYRMGSLS